ncbi:MAG: endolytic transglycosylase MltG [Clostridia bacterium]|nr:endolytic transglycosylase MltG [Clostridia bacterium]
MAKTKRRIVSKKFYNSKTLMREREYGFYWYDALWRFARPIVIFLISLTITAGFFVSAWLRIYDGFLAPVDVNDKSTRTFVVQSGEYVATIANHLVEQGFVRNKGIFRYMVMFKGLTNDIQYGKYELSPSMTTSEIIDILSSGSSSRERTITIIPGWTVEDIGRYLLSVGAIEDMSEFLTYCDSADYFAGSFHQVRQAVEGGRTSERKYLLEGYLAPDTYRVFVDASIESILRKLLGQTEIVMDQLYAGFEGGYEEDDVFDGFVTNLTQDEIIIMASIIEKEAVTPQDMARVSAVFYNRLADNAKLEADSTVKYITGSTEFILSTSELNEQNPYNTYVVTGLPPGPICNPSRTALNAALHPDEDYLNEGYFYFCSTDPHSGTLYFSKTLEEHNAAVAEYMPLWQAYDEEQRALRESAEQADTEAQP